jgi:pimeloyl-ACP methyl ester carboxylesterase
LTTHVKYCSVPRSHSAPWVVFVVLILALASCSDNNENPEPEPEDKYLVDAELVYTATATQMKLLAQFSGFPVDINEFKYDVDLYKVEYLTTHKGSSISASGLIALPKTTQEVPMISFHHGTLTLHSDAPSNFSASDPNALLYGALSSSGFIGVVPDYLGFGSSSNILHPYYVEEYTASAILDMLEAAKELAVDKGIKFNTRLFLAGYSEGGYATVAAHKAVEERKPEGFDLIASFAGAGAYDLSGMRKYLFDQQTYDDPHYLAYIVRSYQLTYDFSSALTDFFKEPYAGRIPALFDGQKGATEIDSQLTPVISDLIHEKVLTSIDTDPAYAYLVNAFQQNSLLDWTPTKKLYLYHGEDDTTVPYQNSAGTYESLISEGASVEDLELIPLEGTHSSALEPFLLDFIPKLWALR